MRQVIFYPLAGLCLLGFYVLSALAGLLGILAAFYMAVFLRCCRYAAK